jgi:hypothetical protein
VNGSLPDREDPAACRFCGRPALVTGHWRAVTLHPSTGLHTHTQLVGVPRCTACRRKNRIVASVAAVVYGGLVVAGAFLAAGFAVSELGFSGENARIVRWLTVVAVVLIGFVLSSLAPPVVNWLFFRKDPQVMWWRELSWQLLDRRPDSG